MVTAVLIILGLFLTALVVASILSSKGNDRLDKFLTLVFFALLQAVMLAIALQNGALRAEAKL